MEFTIRLFGPAREAVGSERTTVTLVTAPTVLDLLTALAAEHPGLETLLERSRVAINHAYADPDARLTPEDEIAVIPPLGGG